MIRAQSADGKIHEFPDGTRPEVIDRTMKDYAKRQTKAPPQRGDRRGAVKESQGFLANLNRGTGVGDELVAFGHTMMGPIVGRTKWTDPFVETYKRELAAVRGAEDDFSTRRPLVAAGARGTGTAATVAIPVGGQANLFAQGTRLENAARGATMAGLQGAAYAAADRGTLEERLQAASDTATNPFVLGLGAVGGVLATPARPKPKAPPSRPQLTDMRKKAYADVKASGQSYTPEQFAGVVQKIKRDLVDADFDPDFDPAVATMLRKLDERAATGQPQTIGEIDRVRRAISKNVARRGDGNQRRLGGQMIRSLDESLDEAGGDELLKNARDLYAREQKVRSVEAAMAKAGRNSRKSGSGANGDNAIRQRMDALLKTPGLKPDEIAAIEDIVMGDPVRNSLRSYGQTSPIAGGLAGMLNAGAILPTGGSSILMHSVPSTAAKVTADQLAKAKVRDLVRLMAAGGTREQLLAIQRQAADVQGPAGDALRRMVAARLSAAAGAGGGMAGAGQRPNLFAQP